MTASEQLTFKPHIFIGATSESRKAALRIYDLTGAMKWATFNAIERAGARGRTDKELEEELNLKGSTQRPRRREVEQAGLIERNGQRREGAAVWVLTEEGRKAAGR